MKTYTGILAAGLIAAAAAFAPGAALAQQKLVLKASDVHPEGYPTVVAMENMGKKLAAADQWPPDDADVPDDAARRREGSHRAGASRRHRLRARLGRPVRSRGPRTERFQHAFRVP